MVTLNNSGVDRNDDDDYYKNIYSNNEYKIACYQIRIGVAIYPIFSFNYSN